MALVHFTKLVPIKNPAVPKKAEIKKKEKIVNQNFRLCSCNRMYIYMGSKIKKAKISPKIEEERKKKNKVTFICFVQQYINFSWVI